MFFKHTDEASEIVNMVLGAMLRGVAISKYTITGFGTAKEALGAPADEFLRAALRKAVELQDETGRRWTICIEVAGFSRGAVLGQLLLEYLFTSDRGIGLLNNIKNKTGSDPELKTLLLSPLKLIWTDKDYYKMLDEQLTYRTSNNYNLVVYVNAKLVEDTRTIVVDPVWELVGGRSPLDVRLIVRKKVTESNDEVYKDTYPGYTELSPTSRSDGTAGYPSLDIVKLSRNIRESYDIHYRAKLERWLSSEQQDHFAMNQRTGPAYPRVAFEHGTVAY